MIRCDHQTAANSRGKRKQQMATIETPEIVNSVVAKLNDPGFVMSKENGKWPKETVRSMSSTERLQTWGSFFDGNSVPLDGKLELIKFYHEHCCWLTIDAYKDLETSADHSSDVVG